MSTKVQIGWRVQDDLGCDYCGQDLSLIYYQQQNAIDAAKAYLMERMEFLQGPGSHKGHCYITGMEYRQKEGTLTMTETGGHVSTTVEWESRKVSKTTETKTVEVDGETYTKPVTTTTVVRDWAPMVYEGEPSWSTGRVMHALTTTKILYVTPHKVDYADTPE